MVPSSLIGCDHMTHCSFFLLNGLAVQYSTVAFIIVFCAEAHAGKNLSWTVKRFAFIFSCNSYVSVMFCKVVKCLMRAL